MEVSSTDTKKKENYLPWVMKHKPNKLDDILISSETINKIITFIENFKENKKSKKKGLILFGPTGCGKTTLVHAIANTTNSEIVEVNSSDTRNKDSIKSIIGNSSKQMSLFNSGKIILIDEIDAISGRYDRGGVPELVSVINESAFPVIMTSNNPWDSKLSKLRGVSQIIEIKEISSSEITKLLTYIAQKESLKFDDGSLDFISRMAKGDIRSAVNDLQSSVEEGNQILRENLSKENIRDVTSKLPDALTITFKSKDFKLLKEAFSNFEGNFDDVFLWMDYNLPKEYEDPNALAEAYEYLSMADVYNGRIRKWQYWRYLVYINLFLSCGVGLSKEEANKKFVKYQQSSRILKIWMSNRKNAKRDAISEKIAKKIHWSKTETIKNIAFYKAMSQNKDFLNNLAKEVGLEKDECEWLGR